MAQKSAFELLSIRYVVAVCDMFMHVPCWKLPALHRAVRARPESRNMEIADGYVHVLRDASAGGAR
ncbi:hypothetical protein [Brevundimonas sp. TWP2-3-4b2]|uniref:hypothetical protein n=1 Tax=Brevundimonas sp. TWP2-3-4b2 TaxID=2804595 RepID=UPI003CEB7280